MKTTREIDRIAQDVLRAHIPPSWLIREQHPDIHIDYFIEIADSSGPSGSIFAVQLKGTKVAKYSSKHIKIYLKTKHLSYYLDKVKKPVFVVAIDVKIRSGFWVFIQEWLINESEKRNWRKNNKIVVAIPKINTLSDTKKLHNAISKAETYMRELWPSSITAAINYEKKSLEKLDPRIDVAISYDKGKTAYTLIAREDFDFNMQFKFSESFQRRFGQFLESGKEITIDRNEVLRVSGSPLLESVFNKSEKGKLVLGPGKKTKATLILSVIDSEQKKRAAIYGIPGTMYSGSKIVTFEGGLEDSPLKIDFSFPFPPSLEGNPLKVNLDFNTSPWENIPILELPFFEKLFQFLGALVETNNIQIEFETKGNHIFTAYSSADLESTFMEPSFRHLKFLNKIRRISKKVGINPKYPREKEYKFTKQEMENILLLDQLLLSGEYRQNGQDARFKVHLLPSENFIKTLNEKGGLGGPSEPLILEPKDLEFSILGEEFSFGPLIFTLTNPILETDLEQIYTIQDFKKGFDLVWAGGPDSELIISIK